MGIESLSANMKTDFESNIVSTRKVGILVEIKACEKFYRRHITDIPRIKF